MLLKNETRFCEGWEKGLWGTHEESMGAIELCNVGAVSLAPLGLEAEGFEQGQHVWPCDTKWQSDAVGSGGDLSVLSSRRLGDIFSFSSSIFSVRCPFIWVKIHHFGQDHLISNSTDSVGACTTWLRHENRRPGPCRVELLDGPEDQNEEDPKPQSLAPKPHPLHILHCGVEISSYQSLLPRDLSAHKDAKQKQSGALY